jgi:hypothetical protein
MSLEVTTSSSTSTSVTLATTSGDSQTLDLYSSDQTLINSVVLDEPADEPVALLLTGDATAVGEDTLALGSMQAVVDGTGAVTVASGSADFLAAAAGTGDESAFASATSYGELLGTSYLIVIGSNTEILDQDPDGSLWVATSETTLFGLDPDSSGADFTAEPLLGAEALSDTSMVAADEPYDLSLEGNVAIMDVAAEVSGDDTLLDVEISVLTVEDALSTLQGELIAIVG